jgi:hypothetical protein
MSRAVLTLLLVSALSTSVVEHGQAQATPPGAAVTSPVLPVPATLAQLMKGTFYPESNVVFAAQDVNPTDVPHAKDPSMATDPLASQYGKWEAVENQCFGDC